MKKIDGILRLSLGLSWVLGTAAILLVVLVLLLPWRKARIKACNYYGHWISPVLLWIVRARPRLINREIIERSKPAIYISNHTSMTDIFLGMWLLPIGGAGIAKKEVAKVPFFGWAYRLSGHLLIDRQNREKAIAGMKEIGDTVRDYEMSIWMWPEGTRSKDGRLKPLKKGVVHLAIATGLPVVPIVVAKAHENWPLKEMTTFNKMEVPVTALEPIDTTGWSVDTMDEHLAELHKAMADALPEPQKPLEPAHVA